MKVTKLNLLLLPTAIFFIVFWIGYFTSTINPQQLKPVDVSFTYIFLQNIKVLLTIIFTGIFSAGIFPLIILSQNALITGIGVKNIMFAPDKIGLILLHGSIEMPMFLIATYISLALTYKVYKDKQFISLASICKLTCLACFGLIIAACVEVFVTPGLI